MLVDGVGRQQLRAVPDHLYEWRVAVASGGLRISEAVEVSFVVFRPTGEYLYTLSPTGVAACPIWRMVHAAG